MTTAARAGAPVALIGAAVANLACVPLFVHAFTIASPLSVALLRLVGCAAVLVLLLPVMRRVVQLRSGPWWHPAVWALGVAGMNTTFYLSIDRIPLAIAVAVSFTGPIGVAAWHSRTRRHALGVVLVAIGVLALVHPGLSGVDPVGLGLALANAGMWALYISAVRRLTGDWSPLSALVAGTVLGSLLLVPGAAATGGLPLDHLGDLAFLAAAGALSAGLPYLVELFVMQRLTTRTFSVLQALYPAAGVAVGAIGLGQRLRLIELAGIVLVMAASVLALESASSGAAAERSARLTGSGLAVGPAAEVRQGRVMHHPEVARDEDEPERPRERQDRHDQDRPDDLREQGQEHGPGATGHRQPSSSAAVRALPARRIACSTTRSVSSAERP